MILAVVVDAGHGYVPYAADWSGYTGAMAPDGTPEDALALQVSKLVLRVLQEWPGARSWVAAAYGTRAPDWWSGGAYWPWGQPIPEEHIPPDFNGDGYPDPTAPAARNASRSLPDRVYLAEHAPIPPGALDRVLVSLHFNTAPDPERRGAEVIYPRTGPPERQARSALLGALILTRLVRHVTGLPPSPAAVYQDGRGLYILEQARVPAVIVELAYLTNPVDLALARDPFAQWQMALAVVAGLWDYARWLAGAPA